jgi:hypothetical protein
MLNAPAIGGRRSRRLYIASASEASFDVIRQLISNKGMVF